MTLMLAGAVSAGAVAQELTGSELAVRNINRAMDLVDASWEKTIIGGDDNLYMADSYNLKSGTVSGPSDIWPLTAAVGAHCWWSFTGVPTAWLHMPQIMTAARLQCLAQTGAGARM